jgi:hypothetical protein
MEQPCFYTHFQIVIDSLARAIPAILNVLAVCMTFWLVFDIAAVQVFGGAFWSCQDADGNILDPSVVPNMTVCESNESKALGYQWVNYNVNFDNVLIGFVALFQLVRLLFHFLFVFCNSIHECG